MRNEKDLDALFVMADMAMEEGRMDEGKAMLEEILLIDPGYGRAHNHLGWFYAAKLSDFNRAQEHLELALKFSPDYPAVYLNLGRVYMQVGAHYKGVDLLKRALEVPGTDKASVFDLLSGIYESMGNLSKALKYAKHAIDEANNNAFMSYLKDELKRIRTKRSFFSSIGLF